MTRETILNIVIVAFLVIVALGGRRGGLMRSLAVWYGNGILRLITLGRYTPNTEDELARAFAGSVGLVVSLAALIYFLYRLAPAT